MMPGRVLLTLVVVSSSAFAQEGNRVRELEERVADLEQENEALRKKIEWLQRLRPRVDGRETHRAVIRVGGDADRDHLEGIILPEGAAKDDVRQYVARVLRAAASHRNTYGADDPEVDLLQRVGPAHVDVLIEPLVHLPFLDGGNYLVEALKRVVGEQHRELVLEALPSAYELVEVVVVRGWTERAAPILLKVLENRSSWTRRTLPSAWIEAVAALKRPESYEHLKTYFYYGANRYHTWEAIRDLPGLELKPQVDRLWPWAKKLTDNWVRINVAAVAAHYGHLDALEVLFEEPDHWPNWDIIVSVTPYRGRRDDVERAAQWFKAHRNRLVFDTATGRYCIAEGISGKGER